MKLREAVQTLVQLNFNHSAYDAAKKKGEHLEPFKCNSTQIAAYRFKPQFDYTLDDIAKAAKAFDEGTNQFVNPQEPNDLDTVGCRDTHHPMQTDITPTILDQYRESGTYKEDQVVFWDRNSQTTDDLTPTMDGDDNLRNRFAKNNLTRLPRPKHAKHDRVGLAESFRIRQHTLHSLSVNSQKFTVDQKPKLIEAVEIERKRQIEDLKMVRLRMVEVIRKQWTRITQSLPPGHPIRSLTIDAPATLNALDTSDNLKIKDKGDYQITVKIAKLIDLHRELMRLHQLLT